MDKAKDDQDHQGRGDKGGEYEPIGKIVHHIFRGVATSTSKRQDKLTLREIMATEPTTPRYIDWSKYPI